MKLLKVVAFLSLFLVTSIGAYAQKDHQKDAYEHYKYGRFNQSIQSFLQAVAKEPKALKKGEYYFMIGRAYQVILQPQNAEENYNKALKLKFTDSEKEIYFNLAELQRESGNYKDALDNYKKYQRTNPSDALAKNGIEACKLARDWEKNPTRYVVSEQNGINTVEFDYGAGFTENANSLYFSSTRNGSTGSGVDSKGMPFADIWVSTRDNNGKWSAPSNIPGEVNTEFNEATPVLTPDKKHLFFTRCLDDKKKNIGCNLCYSEKKNEKWGEAKIVNLNKADSITTGHPAISADGKKMVFASDLPGGKGGLDLWICDIVDIKKDSFGKPRNLSAINTRGDEVFPFLKKDGTLYFASNGHIGMGGLDIFKAEKEDSKWSWKNPDNLRFPINTSAHDFNIIFESDATSGEDLERGYLSSNRKTEARDDIYSFKLPDLLFTLEVNVFNIKTNEPVSGAKIAVQGPANSYEKPTGANGQYLFDTKENAERFILESSNYSIVVTHDDYLVGKESITTVGLEENTKFVKNLYITGKKGEIDLPDIVYEFDKWGLLVDANTNSKDSLDYLFETLTDNPNIVIELNSHTDSRGSLVYNDKLSQKRAQTCVDYLIKRGIPKDRMVAKGKGERSLKYTDKVINAKKTEEEREWLHRKNRRTNFTILSTDYVPKEQR